MICPWNTAQDISRYLGNSILRYDGVPYLVVFMSATKLCLYKLAEVGLGKQPAHSIAPTDPLLDVESPPVGYFNHDGDAYHVIRYPYKQFSQGLTDRNTNIVDIDGGHTESSLYIQGVEDMIVGKYPTFEECWKMLDEEWHSVAVSIDVALSRHGVGYPTTVYYKGEVVGFINPNSMKVIVPSSERGWIVSRYLAPFGWEIE